MAANLLPCYVPVDKTVKEIGLELCKRLDESPDETFCFVAIENKIIHAFVAGYESVDDVFLWQARACSGFKYAKVMFEGVKCWAKGKLKDKLRLRTDERLERFFARKYKFEKDKEGMLLCLKAKAVVDKRLYNQVNTHPNNKKR